jgi:hypothetical protein
MFFEHVNFQPRPSKVPYFIFFKTAPSTCTCTLIPGIIRCTCTVQRNALKCGFILHVTFTVLYNSTGELLRVLYNTGIL